MNKLDCSNAMVQGYGDPVVVCVRKIQEQAQILPFTGIDLGLLALGGAGLVVLGLVSTLLSRRG